MSTISTILIIATASVASALIIHKTQVATKVVYGGPIYSNVPYAQAAAKVQPPNAYAAKAPRVAGPVPHLSNAQSMSTVGGSVVTRTAVPSYGNLQIVTPGASIFPNVPAPTALVTAQTATTPTTIYTGYRIQQATPSAQGFKTNVSPISNAVATSATGNFATSATNSGATSAINEIASSTVNSAVTTSTNDVTTSTTNAEDNLVKDTTTPVTNAVEVPVTNAPPVPVAKPVSTKILFPAGQQNASVANGNSSQDDQTGRGTKDSSVPVTYTGWGWRHNSHSYKNHPSFNYPGHGHTHYAPPSFGYAGHGHKHYATFTKPPRVRIPVGFQGQGHKHLSALTEAALFPLGNRPRQNKIPFKVVPLPIFKHKQHVTVVKHFPAPMSHTVHKPYQCRSCKAFRTPTPGHYGWRRNHQY